MKRHAVLFAGALFGCAGARPSPPTDVAPAMAQPLASFAALHMVVFPIQFLRVDDTPGWSARTGDPKAYLASVDQAMETAFRDRGLGSVWAFPSDLARTARRNPGYASDPAAIRVGDAVRVMERRRDAEIPEPVASQLRVLIGFHDARYALIPVDLRFEPNATGGGGRAVVHVAILDVRGSKIAWAGDVASEMVSDFSPTLATALARRFADLVVAR